MKKIIALFFITLSMFSCRKEYGSFPDLFKELPVKQVMCESTHKYDSLVNCFRVKSNNKYTICSYSPTYSTFALSVSDNNGLNRTVEFQNFGRAKAEVLHGANFSFVNDSILCVTSNSHQRVFMFYNLNDIYYGRTRTYESVIDVSEANFPSLFFPIITKDSIVIGCSGADSQHLITTFNLTDNSVHKCLDVPEYLKTEHPFICSALFSGELMMDRSETRFAAICSNVDAAYFGKLSKNGECEISRFYQFSKPKYTLLTKGTFTFEPDHFFGFSGRCVTNGEKIYALYTGQTKQQLVDKKNLYQLTNLIYVFDFDGNPLYSCVLDKRIRNLSVIDNVILGTVQGEEDDEFYVLDLDN